MDKQLLRDEIVACGRDPCRFIRKHVRIRHPQRGLIPFDMYSYQETLVRDYIEHRFNVVLKARQLGISEITASFAAWLMLFHRDKSVLVMASKAETAKNIIRKVKTALKKLPGWLMLAEIVTDNKLSIELSNGSIIKATATSEDAGRSEALSLLIIDEAAFVPRFAELWTGLYPTVQAGGRVIVISTPNGVGNKFHKIYADAEDGANEFHSTKLLWWVHPERIADLEDDPDRPGFKTSSWFRNEIRSANMSPREVAQELEANFNASGETVVAGDGIRWIEESCLLEPIARRHWDRNVYVWSEHVPGRRYLVSGDVARGDGRDYSAAHVFDVETMEQVAEYYGRIKPDEFARVVCDLGEAYGDAPLFVENNSIGLACLEHVKLFGYPNVYYSRKGDGKPGELVNSRWGTADDSLVVGFTMSPRNRPLVVAKLEESIRNRTITIRSRRFLDELRTFVWVGGRPEAMRNHNDDLVVAGAIGAWMRDTFFAPSLRGVDAQKKILAGIATERRFHNEIPGAAKDPRFVHQQRLGVFSSGGRDRQPMSIRLPRGQNVDLSWLMKN